ncbi:MAG: response regulator, partial [Bdellovibrionaceae bacterium]|nr:response regulator [Pseudobdellovibrionaceae bacterium]
MDKTNVLIVDDRPENILALSNLIQSDDIQIFSAESAEAALDLLVRHDFALALLDVQMPIVTGFELARLIRGVKKFKHLPIIFVTAQPQDQSAVFEGYETGAVDLMFKPLDPHVVRSKVRVFVQLDQQSRLLKSQMDQLERLKQQADVANTAKSHFLANMSHEIRTPLTAVLGFVDVLSNDDLSKEERGNCLSAIHRNGDLLLRLIDDVLDLSKIEAQRLVLETQEFSLVDLLRDVNAALSLKAKAKGISLKMQQDDSLKGHYVSDPSRIKQVLLNIIGNAIKFTTKGNVEVIATSQPVESSGKDRTSEVVFTVIDTGVGLSTEQAKKLFQPFIQADASTRRQFGGTGLGLMISKKIAQALGGTVELISSQPGKGSTFEIRFKLLAKEASTHTNSPIQQGSPSKQQFEELQGKRILVVDDSSDNRALVQMFLRSSGLELDFASSAQEAFKLIEAKRPDLIYMDIQMPEMDGHEATQKLRREGFSGPIVALTAHVMKEEHEKCRESGCNSILTKPI